MEFYPTLQGGTSLSMALDLQMALRAPLAPQTLPGGRPIPGIVGGELPGIPSSGGVIYLGAHILGVFLPLEHPTPMFLKINIHKKGLLRGTVRAISPDDQGENSGVLILVALKENFWNAERPLI